MGEWDTGGFGNPVKVRWGDALEPRLGPRRSGYGAPAVSRPPGLAPRAPLHMGTLGPRQGSPRPRPQSGDAWEPALRPWQRLALPHGDPWDSAWVWGRLLTGRGLFEDSGQAFSS